MFKRLFSLLRRPATAPVPPLPARDARHLLGALMVRMARIDATMQLAELRAMDRLFADRFGLDAVAAARFRADCERLEATLPPNAGLGPLLREAIPADQRAALHMALEQVAAADGQIDPREAAMITAIRDLLANGDTSPAV